MKWRIGFGCVLMDFGWIFDGILWISMDFDRFSIDFWWNLINIWWNLMESYRFLMESYGILCVFPIKIIYIMIKFIIKSPEVFPDPRWTDMSCYLCFHFCDNEWMRDQRGQKQMKHLRILSPIANVNTVSRCSNLSMYKLLSVGGGCCQGFGEALGRCLSQFCHWCYV